LAGFWAVRCWVSDTRRPRPIGSVGSPHWPFYRGGVGRWRGLLVPPAYSARPTSPRGRNRARPPGCRDYTSLRAGGVSKRLRSFFFLASGAAMRPIHDTPIAARSLRDFWGKRWNRAVSAWLYRFVFLPLARQQRPDLALLCACLVSGALHAWVAWVALGAFAAFEVAAFFGLQAVLILAEDRLHVHAWPAPLARAWTLTILLATSPLIICPYLRIVHL